MGSLGMAPMLPPRRSRTDGFNCAALAQGFQGQACLGKGLGSSCLAEPCSKRYPLRSYPTFLRLQLPVLHLSGSLQRSSRSEHVSVCLWRSSQRVPAHRRQRVDSRPSDSFCRLSTSWIVLHTMKTANVPGRNHYGQLGDRQ